MKGLAVAGALLAVSACGGGSDEPTDPTPTPEKTAAGSGTPTAEPTPSAVELSGTPAPEALSKFRCEEVDSGWAAAGLLTNDSKESVNFQVTVYIGPADGTDREATTQRFAKVAAGGSMDFKFEKISNDGSECHVQVLKTK